MEVTSRRRAELISRRERSNSPERTMVWTEPKPRSSMDRKIPVVYYLSRNGHLEHPHFMEVSVALGEGLYLRDVIKRLNSLRGKGMANLYSWSSKRSYKNGFVWHDLSEDDFIYPAHGSEYILKGSELLNLDSSQDETQEIHSNPVKDDSNTPIRIKNRTHWGSFDLGEYKVYKNKITPETSVKNSDAWTQTEEKRTNTQSNVIKEEEKEEEGEEEEENAATELNRNEISPPSSSSSSETLEGLIKADGRNVPIGVTENDKDIGNCSRSRKIKTPMALMQLISCGSISAKDKGFSLVSHFKGRMPRVMSGIKESEGSKRNDSFSPELEEKEYFSGSLIELKKKANGANGEFSSLRRSSSCNADRGLKMELAEEIEGVRARCIPRRSKATAVKKECDVAVSSSLNESNIISDERLRNN